MNAIPMVTGWMRCTFLFVVAILVAVFATAIWLKPYDDNGQPLRMETHRRLGLPPCTFYATTGLPCPSCGMTTSFTFLIHGDLVNSLRANAVGTLLALFCLAMIPWCLACAIRGRLYFIWSVDRALVRAILAFVVLSLVRWIIVLGLAWFGGPKLWKTGG